MNLTEIIDIMSIVGTIAFSSMGTMIGIRKNMDLFGVITLGVVTATGGGAIRDIILGILPPKVFQNSRDIILSIITSVILFLLIYYNKEVVEKYYFKIYEKVISFFDAIGLGIFTVIGINTAMDMGYSKNKFLLIFVGVITAVGGGMLRDIMTESTPFIFKKHIYACACIIGAISYLYLLRKINNELICMLIGAGVVIVIRLLSAYYRLDLPKVELVIKNDKSS